MKNGRKRKKIRLKRTKTYENERKHKKTDENVRKWMKTDKNV